MIRNAPAYLTETQMYTANTMASAIEALGMTLPGSSSFPAESQEKHNECTSIGPVMYNLLEKNILPREIMTRSAFENAMVSPNFPSDSSLACGASFPYHTRVCFWKITGSHHDSRRFDERGPPLDRNGALRRN